MLFLVGGLMTGMVFETFSVSYLVPGSACELKTTNSQQGLMAGMPLVGILATSHFWGYFADTKGRRKVLRISLVLGFLTGALSCFSPNWIVFGVLKLLASSAVSGTMALSLTFLGECTPHHRRSLMVILTTSIFLVAAGVMAVLSIPILPLKFSYHIPVLDIYFNSWRVLGLIFTLPCCLGAIGMTFVYESPKYLLKSGMEKEALKVLTNIYVMNTGKSGNTYKVLSVELDEENLSDVSNGFWVSVKSQTLPLMRPPLLNQTILLAFLYVVIYFCVNPYTVWIPYIVDAVMKSVDRGDTGLSFCEMIRSSHNSTFKQTTTEDCSMNDVAMTMVFGIDALLALINLFMGSLIACCGKKRLLIGIQVLTGAAGICINFVNNFALTVILFIAFVSMILNFGLLSAFSVETFPTYLKAMAVCLTVMVGRVSAVFGINLLKELLVTNCELSFYVFGSLAIAGGLVGFLLPSETPSGSRKEIEN